jgi:hypothetical protein
MEGGVIDVRIEMMLLDYAGNNSREGSFPVWACRLVYSAMAIASLLISGCAFVPQANREFLSDPIMQRQEDGLEGALEGHDFPRREGSVGGSSGSGGGCGC